MKRIIVMKRGSRCWDGSSPEAADASSRFLDEPGSDATGADPHSHDTGVSIHSDFLDIRSPDLFGLSVGMADIVSDLQSFMTDFTSPGHLVHLVNARYTHSRK